jgi:hypothetical protein
MEFEEDVFMIEAGRKGGFAAIITKNKRAAPHSEARILPELPVYPCCLP